MPGLRQEQTILRIASFRILSYVAPLAILFGPQLAGLVYLAEIAVPLAAIAVIAYSTHLVRMLGSDVHVAFQVLVLYLVANGVVMSEAYQRPILFSLTVLARVFTGIRFFYFFAKVSRALNGHLAFTIDVISLLLVFFVALNAFLQILPEFNGLVAIPGAPGPSQTGAVIGLSAC